MAEISLDIVQTYSTGIQNDYINANRANFANYKESMTGGIYEKVNMKLDRQWNSFFYFSNDNINEYEDEECDTWNWKLGKEKDIVHLKNFVLEIKNPNNYKLNQIIQDIEVWIGGVDNPVRIGGSVDLEMTINTFSEILDLKKPVQYKNGKILVPLYMTDFIPYTTFSYHKLIIRVNMVDNDDQYHNFEKLDKIDIKTIEMELYCEKFYNYPKLDNFEALFFQSGFTGTEEITGNKDTQIYRVKLSFNHPTYSLIIVGLDFSVVTNIKLLLDGIIVYDEPPVIQTKSNEPYIIWMNRDFLKNIQTNINFSRVNNSLLLIEGVFTEDTRIDIFSIRFNTIRYNERLYGMLY